MRSNGKCQFDAQVQASSTPFFSASGYQTTDDMCWVEKLSWANRICSIVVEQAERGKCRVQASAGLYFPEYHPILMPDYRDPVFDHNSCSMTVGARIEDFDRRLAFRRFTFDSEKSLSRIIDRIHRTFEDRVFREFELVSEKQDLLKILLQDNWLKLLKFNCGLVRREGLVVLLLNDCEGKTEAIKWAEKERSRLERDYGQPALLKELRLAVERIEQGAS